MMKLLIVASLLLAATKARGDQHPLQAFDSSVRPGVKDPDAACSALKTYSFARDLNMTILDATYHDEGVTKAYVQDVCFCTSPQFNFDPNDETVPLCRVRFLVKTSARSNVTGEVWMPIDWKKKRFLSIGGGADGGCIDYRSMNYGSSLGFATVGSNNGHDGFTCAPLYDNPEAIEDFAHRAMHVQTLVGKEITQAFYQQSHKKSYYLGCSSGGRQGFKSAQRYPDDFDGIVAGAPAINFNVLTGADAMLATYVGAPGPNAANSPSFIPYSSWLKISAEILNQCDGNDGLRDGIITEPEDCEFDPEVLLCKDSKSKSKLCLSPEQVEIVRKVFSPLNGTDGEVLFPRYDPGAQYSLRSFNLIFSGNMFSVADGWFKYVIKKDPFYNFADFGVKDVEYAAQMDPGGISTWDGDLSGFETRGGKLLTFHGRSDELIPSGNSIAYYDLVSETLGYKSTSLDHFYRLFMVPGLDHCYRGYGAMNFNQHFTTRGPDETNMLPSHNILMALVEWVEKGIAPEHIIGTSSDGKKERKHCRHPWKSVLKNGTSEYDCIEPDEPEE